MHILVWSEIVHRYGTLMKNFEIGGTLKSKVKKQREKISVAKGSKVVICPK